MLFLSEIKGSWENCCSECLTFGHWTAKNETIPNQNLESYNLGLKGPVQFQPCSRAAFDRVTNAAAVTPAPAAV